MVSAWLLLLSLCAWGADASSPNLVRSASFEPNASLVLPTRDWITQTQPPGGESAIVFDEAHSGGHSFHVHVPVGAKLTWYITAQTVMNPRVGQRYTVSLFVKTRDLVDGHGAYGSLAFYDKAGKRIRWHDTDKAKGRADWQRYTATGAVPERCAYARVALVTHGHGHAWFDDVKLEASDRATAYEMSPEEQEGVQRFAAAHKEAEQALTHLQRRPGRRLVAVFREPDFPSTPASPSPDALAAALVRAGHAVAFLNAEEMANPCLLPACDLDALVLPYGPYFPVRAVHALKSYLRRGGDLLCAGGYAFDRLVDKTPAGWLPVAEAGAAKTPESKTLFDFEDARSDKWAAHKDARTESTIRIEAGALHLHTPALRRWCCANQSLDSRLSPRHMLTRFRARGTPGQFAIEWRERDGSRWRQFLPLSDQWQEYAVSADDLMYWHDNPSVGRGGPSDRFHPERAAGIVFGFSIEFRPADEPCELWVDDVAVDVDPLAGLRDLRINTRQGYDVSNAGFLLVRPDQLGVFDPVYPLRAGATAGAAEEQWVVPPDTKLAGPFNGWAAIGATGVGSHDRARWTPLLQARDAYGRPAGPLLALLHHYAGPFAGSSIAFCGAEDKDIFADPAGRSLLPRLVAAVSDGLYLRDLKPLRNTVHPGEKAEFSVHAVNFGRQPVQARVVLRVLPVRSAQLAAHPPAHESARSLTLQPNEQQALSFEWSPASYDSPFYLVRAELHVEGRAVDRAETGLCAWSPAAAGSGPTVALEDNVLRVAGRPTYLLGVQGFWGDRSISGGSPLLWRREFELMRDHGVRFCRFINVRARWIGRPEEQVRAYEDALVQLSQEAGVVLFFEDKVWPTFEPKLWQEHLARSRAIGERYRRVRGMVIDLTNEPRVKLADTPAARAAFGEFLRGKYGSAPAVAKAWGSFAGFGQEPATGKTWPRNEPWADARTRDLYAFGVDAFTRWSRDNCNAIHRADPKRLVSVGMLGSYGHRATITAPTLGSLSQDFANRHRYGDLTGMIHHIKEVDLRLFGIPPSIGEFGSLSHPGYPRRAWTDASEDVRITRYVHAAHYGLGLGAIFVSNWHFRDPSASVFTFGLTHPDLVPKDLLKVWRNLNLLFRLWQPKYVPPQVALVLPDQHRWTVARHDVMRAVRRSMDWLLRLHVDFAVVPESRVGDVPATVRALVYPAPFCPSDEVCAALDGHVRRGGHLLVTGDITCDPHGQRTRPARLGQLFGARLVEALGEGLAAPRPAAAIGGAGQYVPRYTGHPCVRVAAPADRVLATDAEGRAVIVGGALGRGRAVFCADAVETHLPETDPRLYRRFLADAGVRGAAIESTHSEWHAFVLHGADRSRLLMAYNYARSGEPQTCALTAGRSRATLCADPLRPTLVMLAADGRPRAVEGRGRLSVDGRPVARTSCHALAGSLDGKALAEAQQLFVVAFSPGQITLTRRNTGGLTAEVGDLAAGQWRTLSPATLQQASGAVTLDASRPMVHEIVLIASPGQMPSARSALRDLLLLSPRP